MTDSASAFQQHRDSLIKAVMEVEALMLAGQDADNVADILKLKDFDRDIIKEAIAAVTDPMTGSVKISKGIETIRATLWDIAQTPKLSAAEYNRRVSVAVVDWLHSRGHFYFHAERRDFASVMYFDAERKILLPIQSDAFLAWLSDCLSMNRAERPFSFVQSACETEGLSDRATGIEPATYWATTATAFYVSNGPGHMVQISAGKVEAMDNGNDGILFPYGATLEPWELVDPRDPFETCSLFRDMSTTAPHGKLLFQLWVCSLMSNQRTKPPCCVSGVVGSGKTRLIVGVFELLGMPARVASVMKNGESDFWAAMDAGGLACFDNADTRVDWLPDALAAAATGGTCEKRRLYTDADRVSLKARSWIALTSSSPSFASDAGLADRLIVVRLDRRKGETAETTLSDEILKNRNSGLSWLCQNLACVLADNAPVPAGLNARHPDFANTAVRIGRAMDRETETVAALQAAESDKSLFNLENDWVGSALLDLLSTGAFSGTAADLLKALTTTDDSLTGKLSVKRLGKRLEKLWPHLEATCQAKRLKDTHTRLTEYEFAYCAYYKTAFPVKSHTRENINTLYVWPSETTQTTQPDLDFDAESDEF